MGVLERATALGEALELANGSYPRLGVGCPRPERGDNPRGGSPQVVTLAAETKKPLPVMALVTRSARYSFVATATDFEDIVKSSSWKPWASSHPASVATRLTLSREEPSKSWQASSTWTPKVETTAPCDRTSCLEGDALGPLKGPPDRAAGKSGRGTLQ